MGIKNKVILFYPVIDRSNVWIPLSILSLVPLVKSEGFEPIIIDCNIEKKPYKILLKHLDNALCVGISCKIGGQIKGAVKVSKLVKTKRPEIPVIWGGYLPTLEPDIVLKSPYIDIIVKGPGQSTLKEILKALKKGHSLKNITGIDFKENGSIIKNKTKPITPLEALPNIQYDKETKKYLRNAIAPKTMMYISSAGCPHGCTFCSVSKFFNAKWHAKKSDEVINDIKKIKQETGANGIFFSDPNFFVDTKRVKSICQKMIKEKLNIKWEAYGRTDQFLSFKPNMIQLLKKSGFTALSVGAESGIQCVLNNIKKDTSTKKNFQLADLCTQHNIHAQFFFIVGFPGNTQQVKKEITATYDITKKLMNTYPDHVIQWSYYKPLTPQEQSTAQKYGFKKPSTIEDFIDLGGFASSANMPWLNKKIISRLDILRFYIPEATSIRRRVVYGRIPRFTERILYHLARWRINNNFFSIPFEYWIKIKINPFKRTC
jgi:radical SAM superfamily enzyme YgiQ (UPF0313 family)